MLLYSSVNVLIRTPSSTVLHRQSGKIVGAHLPKDSVSLPLSPSVTAFDLIPRTPLQRRAWLWYYVTGTEVKRKSKTTVRPRQQTFSSMLFLLLLCFKRLSVSSRVTVGMWVVVSVGDNFIQV
jgi:hypothetical protein